MKIVAKDLRRGSVRIKVEDVDDLWVIKNVVKEGDVVIARTLRDVKLEGEGKRRKTMVVSLKVKNVYFQPFASRLRIHGVIVDAPEGYGLRGSHHTLNIDVGTEFEIVKEEWSESLLRRLETASSRWVKALLLAADFDEASFAVMYRQGVKYLLDLRLPGVNEREPRSIERVAEEVAKHAVRLAGSEEVSYIVVGSPAVLRELIAKKISESPTPRKFKVIADSVSTGGRHGVEELLRRDSVKNLLKEATAVEVEEILNEFTYLLTVKPDKTAVGLKEVKVAVQLNAVSKLLVLEDLLTSEVGEEIEEVVREAEARKALVRIVPSETPSAPKLKGFGGVVAILRYQVNLKEVVGE
ncbi:MAG: pelota family protein [Desulfurococcales archaeon]|nr:pelota family protein [Desulfurococcales archaeon]